MVASWLPGRQLVVVGDCTYLGKHLLKGLPDERGGGRPHPLEGEPDRAAARRARPAGARRASALTTPRQALDDARRPWQDLLLHHPKGEKALQVKVHGAVLLVRLGGAEAACRWCWCATRGEVARRGVAEHRPGPVGRGGDSRLRASLERGGGLLRRQTAAGLSRADGVERGVGGSGRIRWRGSSGSLVVLWYASVGRQEPAAQRQRPWYKHKVEPTFADMLGCCRLHLWSQLAGQRASAGRREVGLAAGVHGNGPLNSAITDPQPSCRRGVSNLRHADATHDSATPQGVGMCKTLVREGVELSEEKRGVVLRQRLNDVLSVRS